MSLAVGSRLGHYAVTALIGEGGMGQVYQATDTKLNRQVALKILPEAFAADPDRLARFQREAQVLASLNHPGIAAIYGLEESGDTRALVLELVEGPTLADRIARPIPVDEALPIAKQIAEALEAAHEAGVIHRDLKPANIKVKEDGTVKVLDFGLAKALDTNPQGDPSQSSTLTAAATQMGVIMGTAAYMSPEQAGGKAVDKRSDIWAFGVVVYEMLTGQRSFSGETVTHVLAAVLRGEPDWNALPADMPASIRSLLLRCLERSPRRRLRDIGEARFVIEETVAEPFIDTAPVRLPQPGWRRALPWVAGLVTGALVAGVGLWNIRPGSGELPLRKFTLPLPSPLTQFDTASVSPDGQMVVYTRNRRLWLQRLDELEPVEILDSSGPMLPFWSPDSNFVAYVAGGLLKRVSAEGGPSTVLCDVSGEFNGGTWGSDGTITFHQTEFGLREVPAQGGESRSLSAPSSITATITGRGFPVHLPDGQSLLNFVVREDGTGEIVVDSGETRASIVSDFNVRDRLDAIKGVAYSPTGHILYSRGFPNGDGVWAVPFSLASLAVTGEPFLVAGNGELPSVSLDGTLVYVVFEDKQRLVWVNRRGEVEGTIGQPQTRVWEPTLSLDGERVIVQGHDEPDSNDIYVHDVSRGTKTRLTFDPAIDDEPVWSPTGDRIAFTSIRLDGSHDIFVKASDGSGEAQALVTGPSQEHAPNWSRDGRYLTHHSQSQEGGSRDVYYLDLSLDDEPTPFLETAFEELVPQMSPDSEHLVYQSNEEGRWEVFVVGFPNGEGKQKVSVNGGMHPRWSP